MSSKDLRKLLMADERFVLEGNEGFSRIEVEIFAMVKDVVFFRMSSFGLVKYTGECQFLPFEEFAMKFDEFNVQEQRAVRMIRVD